MTLNGTRTYVGFGLGPIQTGLFLTEAFASGGFRRLVVAEVAKDVVESVRRAEGRISVNIARASSVDSIEIGPIEILNPNVAQDRAALEAAIAEASEIGTAVPSVEFYRGDSAASLNRVVANGLAQRAPDAPPLTIYTAENNNHAAEELRRALVDSGTVMTSSGTMSESDIDSRARIYNTVIGKMSGVLVTPEEIEDRRLRPLTAGTWRAHLVEEFNRILIGTPQQPAKETHVESRGIGVFIEKDNLLPFEEAKLYGHNAAHALAAYLAEPLGLIKLSDLRAHPSVIEFIRQAFIEESGRALIAKYGTLDRLFTVEGYEHYVDNLIERMFNPYLGDLVFRVGRDPERKLGWNDRLIGTMRLALDHGIQPTRFALGAAAALGRLRGFSKVCDWSEAQFQAEFSSLWKIDATIDRAGEVTRLIAASRDRLRQFVEKHTF